MKTIHTGYTAVAKRNKISREQIQKINVQKAAKWDEIQSRKEV